MSHTITLPFATLLLRTASGDQLAFPLSDQDAFHLDRDAGRLAERFAAHFQRKVLDQGDYMALLDELRAGEFQQKKLLLPVPKSADGVSYPAISLSFDYFCQKREEDCWAVLPALGVEAMAATEAELEEQLIEVVKAEFTSKKRLQSVHHIFATQWYESASLEAGNLPLTTWSPAELLDLKKDKKKALLPTVAEKMEVTQTEAYGRETELSTLERVLQSRFSRNILLVGASGCGKTALVRELAHRKKSMGIEANIWETTASLLIKELTKETGWQDNLTHLVKELTLSGDLLFVRNLAELFEVGQYEGNTVSMGEFLRPFLGRGELTLITECTPEEMARIELRSPSFLAFFRTLQLAEPTDELESIITKKINDFASRHRAVFEGEAVREIIRLHRRFSPYSGMPGKPIRFLESILLGMTDQVAPVSKNKAKAALAAQADQAPVLTIDRDAVLKYYCEESGMPAYMIDPSLPMDTDAIRSLLNANVFGQENAVNAVVDMLAAVKTALTRTGKPIASFLFAGPTGVGKTELAKVLAQFMFGNRDRMIRFDLSEFSDPWSVMRLTGNAFYSDGLLTSAVRREPFCVLLFDEIEKADPKFYELLLQLLSEGRLTDSRGRLVNFCSAIVIMTTNIGASNLQAHRISWKKNLEEKDVTEHFRSAVENYFRPELFNRIDSVVAFAPLSRATVRHVVEREVDLLKKREGIRFRHIDFSMDTSAFDYLAEAGYDPRYGARYLQRTIREKLIVPLAKELNQYDFDGRLTVHVTEAESKLRIDIKADPLEIDLMIEQWSKLTLAEEASIQRRRVMMVMEGALYMKFQSEFDRMEDSLAYLGNDFWRNTTEAKKYQAYKEANAQLKDINQRVEDLELEIALATIGQGAFKTDFGERLDAWGEQFFQLQTHLHSLLYPNFDTCLLTIFGPSPQPPLAFYLELLKKKGFAVSRANSIWFRENHTPPAPLPANGEDENAEPPVVETGPYLKAAVTPEHLALHRFDPPNKNDRMYGIELEVRGPCAWIYLRGESGFQSWETETKEDMDVFYVTANATQTAVPEDVHRSQFYKKAKSRRTMARNQVSDAKLGLSVELAPLKSLPMFIEKLDEQFKEEIKITFVSSDPND